MGKLHKIGLLIRTIRHLKLVQIINRMKRKLFAIEIDNSVAPSVRLNNDFKFYFIKRPKFYLDEDNFIFLNKKEKLSFPVGWNDPKLAKLWLYNLHYFEGLLNDETPNNSKERLIHRWIEQNPPGQGNGWEPYPNSLRIVNWIKWTLLGNQLSEAAIHSLAVQVRYLMQSLEYHLLGNHLFANAKALVFAGLFFEGNEADLWYEQGIEILSQQIPEQFLDDGAHFELSTTYHALLTEDLLDIIQYIKVVDRAIPFEWKKVVEKAVSWLVAMTRPDGLAPLFNDAAYGITPSLKDILSLQKAAGIAGPKKLKLRMTDLPESGYFRYEADDYSFFGDAGQIGPDYIPGHAHCDMLNFELFAHGLPVIVDTGTSIYEVCERRHMERSTSSHNIVQIGNEEQSEIWGAFRVARRAKIIQREVTINSVNAAYKGYNNIQVSHKRRFTFEDEFIKIEDVVNEKNKVIARFHFHPDISVVIKDDAIEAGPIKIEFSGEQSIKIGHYEYAPEFNKLIPAKVLEITFMHNLTTKIIL